MKETRPFIPRNKPKSFVVFALSALIGIGFGILAFAAASSGLATVKNVLLVAFFCCWLVAALAGINLSLGILTGQYRDLPEKPWRDQVW